MSETPNEAGPNEDSPSRLIDAPDSVAPPTSPERTRLSGLWAGLLISTALLALLLVFILQNRQDVHISYLGAHGAMPLGIGLLLAAVAGVVIAGGLGTLRIWELRRRAGRRTPPARKT